ncbi:hypothetical protein DFH09DRAFT_1282463 [Mycena vulgaris]|nr:hypothetical protein DFH09DRAFT_1282463 [Mycena vulgaris]
MVVGMSTGRTVRWGGTCGELAGHTACHGADEKADRLRSELTAEEGRPVECRLATGFREVLTHTLYIEDLVDFKVSRERVTHGVKCGHAPGGEGHMRHIDATQHGEGQKRRNSDTALEGRATSGRNATQRGKGGGVKRPEVLIWLEA